MANSYELRWTPTSKKLPEGDVECLVTLREGNTTCVRVALFVDYQGGSWEDDYCGIPFDKVIAWAPLPTPYYPRRNRKRNKR